MGKGNGKFVFGAFLGAIAGAVVGVLLAPKSGKETRKLIKDKACDYAEKGKDAASDLVKKEKIAAENLVKTVSDKIEKD